MNRVIKVPQRKRGLTSYGSPRFIDYLQGHSSKDTGANIYMKGIKPDVLLKECVSKIDYGIDWEKLKVSWK